MQCVSYNRDKRKHEYNNVISITFPMHIPRISLQKFHLVLDWKKSVSFVWQTGIPRHHGSPIKDSSEVLRTSQTMVSRDLTEVFN